MHNIYKGPYLNGGNSLQTKGTKKRLQKQAKQQEQKKPRKSKKPKQTKENKRYKYTSKERETCTGIVHTKLTKISKTLLSQLHKKHEKTKRSQVTKRHQASIGASKGRVPPQNPLIQRTREAIIPTQKSFSRIELNMIHPLLNTYNYNLIREDNIIQSLLISKYPTL